jgi:hypothetical protein
MECDIRSLDAITGIEEDFLKDNRKITRQVVYYPELLRLQIYLLLTFV